MIFNKNNKINKSELSLHDLARFYFMNSKLHINFDYYPAIEIILEGEISKIPALKNNKSRHTLIPSKQCIAKLIAMDALFNNHKKSKKINFYNEKLFMVLICGERSRSFDVDNCFTTIKDWLEPPTKQIGVVRKFRNWGVGVVADDKQITGACVYADQVNLKTTDSIILLSPSELTDKYFIQFINKIKNVG